MAWPGSAPLPALRKWSAAPPCCQRCSRWRRREEPPETILAGSIRQPASFSRRWCPPFMVGYWVGPRRNCKPYIRKFRNISKYFEICSKTKKISHERILKYFQKLFRKL